MAIRTYCLLFCKAIWQYRHVAYCKAKYGNIAMLRIARQIRSILPIAFCKAKYGNIAMFCKAITQYAMLHCKAIWQYCLLFCKTWHIRTYAYCFARQYMSHMPCFASAIHGTYAMFCKCKSRHICLIVLQNMAYSLRNMPCFAQQYMAYSMYCCAKHGICAIICCAKHGICGMYCTCKTWHMCHVLPCNRQCAILPCIALQ